jgi:general secretion pathway protein M
MTSHRAVSLLARPSLALSSYGLALLVLIGIVGLSIDGMLAGYQDRSERWTAFERLAGRARVGKKPLQVQHQEPSGQVYLEGETRALAQAALLQRVAQVVARAGGTVTSSEVETDMPQDKARSLKVTANLEIEQRGLQAMVYNIEISKPLLFIESIAVNAPAGGEGKLRVVMQVSGQWAKTNDQ